MKVNTNQPQTNKPSWTDVLTMGDPDLECPEHDAMSLALADPAFTLELLRARDHSFHHAIEAKPAVKNPMQVLRQLRTYREFFPCKTQFILWCPTLSEKLFSVFTSQNIYVCNLSIAEIKKL